MPRRRSAERGEGNLGCIVWTLVLAIGIMIAWKAVPAKVASSELYDFMDELAKFSASQSTAEDLEKRILERAGELNIQIERKQIQVQLGRERVRMEVQYTIPLEFPGYTYNWNFHQVLDRPIFIV